MTTLYDRSAVRHCLKAVRDPSPLLAALLAWYAEADEEEKCKIEDGVVNVIETVRAGGINHGFGPAQGLELMGCWIAIDRGWINPFPVLFSRNYRKNGHRGS